jgi:hypothetical protein
MKSNFTIIAAGIAAVLLAVVTMTAHHSNAAQFDSTKRITLKGEVTKVEWTNPHAYIYVSVKDTSGKVVVWFPVKAYLHSTEIRSVIGKATRSLSM